MLDLHFHEDRNALRYCTQSGGEFLVSPRLKIAALDPIISLTICDLFVHRDQKTGTH